MRRSSRPGGRPPRAWTPIAWFAAIAVTVGVVVSASAVSLAETIARDDLRADAEETARLVQSAVVATLEQSPERSIQEHFASTLLPQVQAGTLARVKVWERVGDDRRRLIYSDLPELIGAEKELLPERAELLGTENTLVLPVPDDAAHRTEFTPGVELVEVFTAFRSENRDYLLESYHETTTTTKAERLQRHLFPALLGGMGLFVIATLPLAIALGRRLARAERERAQLVARASREHEEERLRLGQRLHDDVVQDLAGASLALSAIAAEPRPDPDRIERVAGVLRDDIRTLRALLEDLVPSDLDWTHLAGALRELADTLAVPRCIVRVSATPGADRNATQILYRLARELLLNVVRHADAKTVRVSAWCAQGRAFLSVTDDGCGFDPADVSPGHVGLRIIEHTVLAAGGQLEISAEHGAGAQITLHVAARPER